MIGILAAVTIVVYGTWRKNNAISVVKSDLKGVKASMESTRNFNGSAGYPTAIPSTFSASNGVTLTYRYGDTKSFCIEGVNTIASDTPYYITAGTDATAGTCP